MLASQKLSMFLVAVLSALLIVSMGLPGAGLSDASMDDLAALELEKSVELQRKAMSFSECASPLQCEGAKAEQR